MKTFTELRKKRFATRREFAKLFGVHEVTAGKYEYGEISPKIKDLPRIAELFGCTIEEIVYGLIETKKQAEQGKEDKQ